MGRFACEAEKKIAPGAGVCLESPPCPAVPSPSPKQPVGLDQLFPPLNAGYFGLYLIRNVKALAEVVWLQDWLGRAYKAAPKRHAAYSSGWDEAYIRRVMREDATADSEEIWDAIREREATQRWGKLSGRAAHFLRARLIAAGTHLVARTGEAASRDREAASLFFDRALGYYRSRVLAGRQCIRLPKG